MKFTKKTIIPALFLVGISLGCLAGSTISKGQTFNVMAEAPEPTKPLEDLNIADKTQMNVNENTTILGNVLQFGPSIGAFVTYKSKNTYDAVHVSFKSLFSSDLDPNWQRFVLRAEDIDPSLGGEVMGYFVSFYKDNFHLYKQNERGVYTSLSNHYYPSELGELANDIYVGEYIDFDFKCYNVDDGVFMSMSMNNVTCFEYTDTGTKGKVYSNPGYVGMLMNSSKTSWIFKTAITDKSFQPTLFLGDKEIYDPITTANATKGNLRFTDSQKAIVANEQSVVETEFTLKPLAKGEGNKIFAISTSNSKNGVKSFDANDGLEAIFYDTKVVVKYLDNELATINYDNIVDGELAVKLITFFVAGESTFALSINGVWHVYSTKLCTKTSGYVGLYSFATCDVKAPEHEDRNFRILFIGNSITNHGPNADLNYHIGAGSDSWAMATSAPEYDYVHRTVAAVRELSGYEETEFLAINVANWEHDIAQYDYASVYAAGAAFEPDLIVGRLGENVTSMPSAIHFEYYYNRLLNFFNSTGDAKIVLTTKYWGSSNHTKDDSVTTGIINLARKNNYPLVRLDDLGTTYASINNATADYDYYHSLPGTAPGGLSWGDEFDGWTDGVKQHPGMVGHENIAARVSEAVIRTINGDNTSVSKLQKMDDDMSVELNTSSIKAGNAGAYDLAAVTNFACSPITDFSGFTFAKNYVPFKGYNITADGTPYRFEMKLQEDTTAQLTYKAYTYNEDGKTLKEIKAVNNADSVRDGVLLIEGAVNKILILCVEYDSSKIFSGNVFSDVKYGTLMNFMNKGNANYVIDASSSRYLTIHNDVFSILISSGKDIELRLKNGTFIIERKTFEVIASEERPLNFSIDKFTTENDKQNATTAISKYQGFEGLEVEDGLVSSVYEVQVAYDSRNGDALYVAGGIKALLKVNVDEATLPNLGIVGAVLPAMGSEVKNVTTLSDDSFYYNAGTLTVESNDFNKDLILGKWTGEEVLTLSGDYKKEYKVGESLDINGMILTLRNKKYQYETIPLTESMISGFDSSKEGVCVITVTYKGLKTTATLNITKGGQPTSSSIPGSSIPTSSTPGSQTSGSQTPGSSSQPGSGGCGGCNGSITIALPITLGILCLALLGVCLKRKEEK